MPKRNDGRIRVRAIKKDKPDVRALARVLIDLAIAEHEKEQAQATQHDTSETTGSERNRPTERSA